MNWFKRTPIDENGYYETGVLVDQLSAESGLALKIDGNPILLTQVDGAVVAVSGSCPHAAADLTRGRFGRGFLTCPEHEWKFDLRTGRVVWPPDESCRLKRYQVKVTAEGQVCINISPATPSSGQEHG